MLVARCAGGIFFYRFFFLFSYLHTYLPISWDIYCTNRKSIGVFFSFSLLYHLLRRHFLKITR